MATTLGVPVHLTAKFYDANGAPVDPSTVTLNLNLPDGSPASFAAVKDSTGTYHYDYTPLVVGTYDFYFAGSGSNAAAQPVDVFTVTASASSALISLAEAKEQLNKAKTSPNPTSNDDSEVLGFVVAASEIVNWVCGYSRPTKFTEVSNLRWGGLTLPTGIYASLVLRRLPVLSVQSITTQFYGSTLSTTGIILDNDAGLAYIPIGSIPQLYTGPVSVSYTAGRATVPTVLQQATRIIVQHLWETQRGPSGSGRVMGAADDMVMVPGLGQYIPSRAMELMERSPYYAAQAIA